MSRTSAPPIAAALAIICTDSISKLFSPDIIFNSDFL